MPKRTGRPFQREKAQRLRQSDVCWICGQPGADTLDHVIPIARGGTEHPDNKRPAHHNTPNAQGIRCNRVKSSKDYAPIVRRSGTLA